jgi:hypothetical protein
MGRAATSRSKSNAELPILTSVHAASCLLAPFYCLPYCLPSSAARVLPAVQSLPSAAHRPLPTVHCPPSTASSPLPPVHCLQSTASSQLPPVNCLQSTASSPLPPVNDLPCTACHLLPRDFLIARSARSEAVAEERGISTEASDSEQRRNAT